MIYISALLLLTSCSSGAVSNSESAVTDPTETIITESNEETDKEPETVILHSGDPDNKVWAEAYLKALPSRNYNGASFIITSPDTSMFDPSEISYLSDAVSKRNRAVEEKFGVTISYAKSDLPKMLEDAKKNAAAEMFYSHIMSIPFESTGSFVSEGLLMNLRSLPLLDTTMPYFNQSSVAALSAGNKIFGIAGEATPASRELPAVFFNKNVAENLNLEDLYTLALESGLTWDKFHEISNAATAAEGFVGAVVENGATCDYIFASVGEKFVSSGEMKVPTVGFANYSMDVSATHYRRIRDSAAGAGIAQESSVDAFKSGNVLFTIGKISDLDRFSSSSVSLGILPMPKVSADSSYLSLAGGKAPIFTVTEGVTDSEMVSLVLSGLCASSYGVFTEEYVNYLHASLLPDSRSADVLEFITGTAVYDLSTAFGEVSPELRAGTSELVREIIHSGDFKNFNSATENANRYLSSTFPLS